MIHRTGRRFPLCASWSVSLPAATAVTKLTSAEIAVLKIATTQLKLGTPLALVDVVVDRQALGADIDFIVLDDAIRRCAKSAISRSVIERIGISRLEYPG